MFKKYRDKSKNKGNQSKIISSVSKKLQNQTKELKDDYKSNISQINDNNKNLLGSLIEMQEELQKERLKSQISHSPFSKKRISTVIVEGNDKKLTLSQLINGEKKMNSFINGKELSNNSKIRKSKRMKKSDLFKKIDQDKDKMKKDNKYLNEKELILLVITLKKTFIHHKEKNQLLKEEKKNFEKRNTMILKQINKSEDKIAELERKTRIEDRVVYNLDFDLDELDKKYTAMDQNIKDSTGFNSQEPFILQTIEMKEKLKGDMKTNENRLQLLTRNLGNLSSALTKLNDQ